MTRHSFTARVGAYFKDRPGVWVSAIELESIGGRQGWRTRVSEARRRYGLDIQNRVRIVKRSDGSTFKLSEYRLRIPETTVTALSGDLFELRLDQPGEAR